MSHEPTIPPAASPTRFDPTWESLQRHSLPRWFDDVKLGIFVHWGLYSVPAFAPTTRSPELDLKTILRMVLQGRGFEDNPYAEWYLNSLRITGSPVHRHHIATYGRDYDYYDFATTFNQETRRWDPGAWADLFREVGARYVVLTTKHHDGFTLWPSRIKHPHLRPDCQCADRDLVGELTAAVRERGLRMGLYYSGGIDWGFTKKPIVSPRDLATATPQSEAYADFADAHWRELIERYEPAILWNDIGYPDKGDAAGIMADHLNRDPDGVVNDRWLGRSEMRKALLTLGLYKPKAFRDYRTPEYAQRLKISPHKWESVRGLGWSFGYNAQEGPETTLSARELVHLFVDIVSKNGNLMINVGPQADGTIPEIQVDRLRALGRWLATNGEAIYGARPWTRAESSTDGATPVRFTCRGDTLYAILMDKPLRGSVMLQSIVTGQDTTVRLLGTEGTLAWAQREGNLQIALPEDLPDTFAYTLSITGKTAE